MTGASRGKDRFKYQFYTMLANFLCRILPLPLKRGHYRQNIFTNNELEHHRAKIPSKNVFKIFRSNESSVLNDKH